VRAVAGNSLIYQSWCRHVAYHGTTAQTAVEILRAPGWQLLLPGDTTASGFQIPFRDNHYSGPCFERHNGHTGQLELFDPEQIFTSPSVNYCAYKDPAASKPTYCDEVLHEGRHFMTAFSVRQQPDSYSVGQQTVLMPVYIARAAKATGADCWRVGETVHILDAFDSTGQQIAFDPVAHNEATCGASARAGADGDELLTGPDAQTKFDQYDSDGDGILRESDVAQLLSDLGYGTDADYIGSVLPVYGEYDTYVDGEYCLICNDRFIEMWESLGGEPLDLRPIPVHEFSAQRSRAGGEIALSASAGGPPLFRMPAECVQFELWSPGGGDQPLECREAAAPPIDPLFSNDTLEYYTKRRGMYYLHNMRIWAQTLD
jgi:hypothetical protein